MDPTGIWEEGTRNFLPRTRVVSERRDNELHGMLDLIPQITWISNRGGAVTYVNRRFTEYTGIRTTSASGTVNWISLVHPDDRTAVGRLLERAPTGADPGECEFRFRRRDGVYRWHLYCVAAIPNPDGKGARYISTATDIQAHKDTDEERRRCEALLRETNARLEAAAFTDALTGIPNRRSLTKQLQTEWAYAIRYGVSLSLLVLDVDHFKSFNDTFGHCAGDEALAHIAQLLKANSREIDFVARFGGEEFVILLPHSTAEESQTFAERLRVVIAEAAWPLRPITVSIGIATATAETRRADKLLSDADVALYRAKQDRNCVRHSRDEPV